MALLQYRPDWGGRKVHPEVPAPRTQLPVSRRTTRGRRAALLASICFALVSVFVTPANAQTVTSDALFDGSVLHDVRIRINTTDWQTLKDRFMENTYYPCDFQWGAYTVRNVGVRSRGTGSRSGTKPHLGIDFGRYVSGQTFLGLKGLVLRNNIQDPGFGIRERISLQLFRRLGIPGSRVSHARLFINEAYAGLYTMVEPLDTVFLQRAFGNANGYLFSFDSPPAGYFFEYRGNDPAAYVPAPFKPETHSSDPHGEAIVDLVWTINQSSAAMFRTAIREVINIEEFIKHVAIDMAISDNDSILGNWGMSNMYFYREDGSRQFMVLPWDKSNAFEDGPGVPIFHNTDLNQLMARALADPELRALYLHDLLEAAGACTCMEDGSSGSSSVSSARSQSEPLASKASTAVGTRAFQRPTAAIGPGWMEFEVLREGDQVRAAMYADPVSPYTREQFEQELVNLRAFSRARLQVVASAVAEASR